MKLYLCSYRIPTPDKLFELLPKEPGHAKVAFIPNAKDYYAERARSFKLQQMAEELKTYGFSVEIVDLRDFNNSKTLLKKLREFDMLWVGGGNTFCLRDAMHSSGFDQIAHDLLCGEVVYAGESAGACVAGNSLKGLETADEPAFTANIIWEGLNLVPNFILPHVDNAMFADDTEEARRQHQDDTTLIELTDSQALIIDGDKQRIVEPA